MVPGTFNFQNMICLLGLFSLLGAVEMVLLVLPEGVAYRGSPQAGLLTWRGVSACGDGGFSRQVLVRITCPSCGDGDPLRLVHPIPKLESLKNGGKLGEGGKYQAHSVKVASRTGFVGGVSSPSVSGQGGQLQALLGENTLSPATISGAPINPLASGARLTTACLIQDRNEPGCWSGNTGAKVTLC